MRRLRGNAGVLATDYSRAEHASQTFVPWKFAESFYTFGAPFHKYGDAFGVCKLACPLATAWVGLGFKITSRCRRRKSSEHAPQEKRLPEVALLISKDSPWLNTQDFLAAIDANLQKAMA